VEISTALFQRDPVTDPGLLARIHRATSGPVVQSGALEAGVAVLLAEAGLAPSRGEGRRLVAGGGITVNGQRIADPAAIPTAVAGEWLEVRVGKRNRSVVRVVPV
jgi:tyrosyl-tRNA synthetase